MSEPRPKHRGLFEALVGDGRPLLSFTGLALILSGGFALGSFYLINDVLRVPLPLGRWGW